MELFISHIHTKRVAREKEKK